MTLCSSHRLTACLWLVNCYPEHHFRVDHFERHFERQGEARRG